MLSITTKSPYAIAALAELGRAGEGGPVPIGELARRRDIPVQFLEQLFAALAPRRHRCARSAASTAATASPAAPETISVLEVVELLDGPLGAGAAGVFADAADAARAVLAATTIADVIEREALEGGVRCTTSEPAPASLDESTSLQVVQPLGTRSEPLENGS